MATKPTPHYTLVAPSADGTCCPCSALSDPCTCAGLIPIIRCRTRSALAEMIGIVLEAEGYQVFDVYDGAQALDQFHAVAPDLVLLDLMLPGLDGIEICRLIRRESDVPVVMLTAHSAGPVSHQAIDLGAQAFLTKPYSPNELLAVVRRFGQIP